MDPAPARYATPDAHEEQRPPKAGPLVMGGLVALVASEIWLVRAVAPGELIRPVDPNLFAAAVFVGVLSGLLLAARPIAVKVSSDARPGRRMDAIGGAMILPLLVSTACLRVTVQAVAFVGIVPQSTTMSFTIDGFRVNHGSHYLRVRLGAVGREFSVPVGSTLYGATQRGDSITLAVQTSRFGVQRAMVGADLTAADLHRNP